MTLFEAIESGKPFRRPHWKPGVYWIRKVKCLYGDNPALVWDSSGDAIDEVKVTSVLADDYELKPDPPPPPIERWWVIAKSTNRCVRSYDNEKEAQEHCAFRNNIKVANFKVPDLKVTKMVEERFANSPWLGVDYDSVRVEGLSIEQIRKLKMYYEVNTGRVPGNI